MGEPNEDLMDSLKVYSAAKFGKTRAEVEKEIQDRWSAAERARKAEKPEIAPEANKSPLGTNSIGGGKNITSTPKTAPKASETPEKGFLDDWIAKNLPPAPNEAPAPSPQPNPEPEPTSQSDEAIFKIR